MSEKLIHPLVEDKSRALCKFCRNYDATNHVKHGLCEKEVEAACNARNEYIDSRWPIRVLNFILHYGWPVLFGIFCAIAFAGWEVGLSGISLYLHLFSAFFATGVIMIFGGIITFILYVVAIIYYKQKFIWGTNGSKYVSTLQNARDAGLA